MHAKPLQSHPTLCNPMDCSPPGSSVHGISQARILEQVAVPSSRGSSRPRDGIHIIEACVQDLIFLSREDRDLGFPFQTHLRSQAWYIGEAKNSALLPSRDADILVPPEWPQGSPASSSLLKDTVQSLGWEDPLEEDTATHFCIPAWRIPWTDEPGGLQSIGLQRVGHD